MNVLGSDKHFLTLIAISALFKYKVMCFYTVKLQFQHCLNIKQPVHLVFKLLKTRLKCRSPTSNKLCLMYFVTTNFAYF